MRNKFTYYYRYERIFHKDSVNKYELTTSLDDYIGFNDEIETKVFHSIFFQSERASIYTIKKQGVNTLTVLVPWEKKEKVAVMNIGHDGMIIIASPDYQTVEILIASRSVVSYMELLKLLKSGDYYSEIKSLRKKAGIVS